MTPPQAAPDGAEAAQGDAPAGAGGQAAGSQSADQGSGLSWREAEGGVEVTGYAGDETDLAIPSELGGRPVVRVGGGAFRGCTSLRSVSLPPAVESVGDGAFSGCSSLASLTLPEGLRRLGSNAFDGCPLESVTVPASLESTGAHRWAGGPFEGSSLRSATLAEGSARVVPGLFSGCSTLSSVSVPGTVTSVGEYAFRGCSGLATLTLPASVSAIGDASFEGCSDALTLRFPMSYALLGYVHEHHMRYEVLAGNMAMGQGILDASGSGYSCEGADGEGHLRLRLRYEVAQGEGDGLSEMALRLRLSDQAQVLRGSVRLDGEVPEGLAERQGMLTIPVRGTSGSVELSVRAAQHGRLQSYASLNYTKGGERHDDLIGYVDEELPKTTMELPALVGAGCLVGGVAAPGSTVTILADGEPAGSGEADAKGRYRVPVSVAGGEGRAYSFQALAAGAASAARDAEYDPAFPEVKSVTLEYRSRGREGRLELMDPSASDQHVHRDISSPPTYRVAFTDPDAVAEVSLTGRGRGKERTLKATREADGTWATSGFFDESDKGFNPQSVTVHHRARGGGQSDDEVIRAMVDRILGCFNRGRLDIPDQVKKEYKELKGSYLFKPKKKRSWKTRHLGGWQRGSRRSTARRR